jgi:nitroimidazol reductase NimA-like FMN-containing flavoprotein (pyridoxamine 5'-phosphate oxidase superfamily)
MGELDEFYVRIDFYDLSNDNDVANSGSIVKTTSCVSESEWKKITDSGPFRVVSDDSEDEVSMIRVQKCVNKSINN